MARIEIELNVKVKVAVEDHAEWAVDYGLVDDSPAGVEADVRTYFGSGHLADELRSRPGQGSLVWKVTEASDAIASIRVIDVEPSPARVAMEARQAAQREQLAHHHAQQRAEFDRANA